MACDLQPVLTGHSSARHVVDLSSRVAQVARQLAEKDTSQALLSLEVRLGYGETTAGAVVVAGFSAVVVAVAGPVAAARRTLATC